MTNVQIRDYASDEGIIVRKAVKLEGEELDRIKKHSFEILDNELRKGNITLEKYSELYDYVVSEYFILEGEAIVERDENEHLSRLEQSINDNDTYQRIGTKITDVNHESEKLKVTKKGKEINMP